EIGIKNQVLIVNGLLQTHRPDDAVSKAFYERQRNALKETPETLKQVATFSLPFVSYSLTGVDNLRYLFSSYTITEFEDDNQEQETIHLPSLNKVIDDFSSKNIRVIFTMGKGGVGKTTIASAIAVGLSEKGHRVHLTTTDPAAHLAYTFDVSTLKENLTISSINPE